MLAALLLTSAGKSVAADHPGVGKIGLSIGYRIESEDVDDGFTFGAFADKQLVEGLAVFGVMDGHRLPSKWTREGSGSFGLGGSVGLKLLFRPREPGLRLIPGIGGGYMVLPGTSRRSDRFGTLRFSLEIAHLTSGGSWFFLEYSLLVELRTQSDYEIWGYTFTSLRVGVSVASF